MSHHDKRYPEDPRPPRALDLVLDWLDRLRFVIAHALHLRRIRSRHGK